MRIRVLDYTLAPKSLCTLAAMYQQPNHSYQSSDSLRRLSVNNPFRPRNFEQPQHLNRSATSVGSAHSNTQNQAFDDWVEKNKQLIEESDDEDFYRSPDPIDMNLNMDHTANNAVPLSTYNNDHHELSRPVFPVTVRAGSDSSVNYNDNRYVPIFFLDFTNDLPNICSSVNDYQRLPHLGDNFACSNFSLW